MIFGEQDKFTEHKISILSFYTDFIWDISHFKKNPATYYHKCTKIFG